MTNTHTHTHTSHPSTINHYQNRLHERGIQFSQLTLQTCRLPGYDLMLFGLFQDLMMFTRVSTSRSYIFQTTEINTEGKDSSHDIFLDRSAEGCSEQPNASESHPCRSFTSILRNQQRPAVPDFTDLDRDQEQDNEANTPHTADLSHNTKHNDQSHNSQFKMPSHNEQNQKGQHGPTKDP